MLPLPVRLELGPVLGHRRVDVEVAALGEQVGARRGGALGGGEHELEAVLGVGRAGARGRRRRPTGRRPSSRRRRSRWPRPPRRAPRSWPGTRPPRLRTPARPSPRSPSCRPPRQRVGTGSQWLHQACNIRRAAGSTPSAQRTARRAPTKNTPTDDRSHRGARRRVVVLGQEQPDGHGEPPDADRHEPCTPRRGARTAARWREARRAARTRAGSPRT